MDPLLDMVKKKPKFWVKVKHSLVERILDVKHVFVLLLFGISLRFGWLPGLLLL